MDCPRVLYILRRVKGNRCSVKLFHPGREEEGVIRVYAEISTQSTYIRVTPVSEEVLPSVTFHFFVGNTYLCLCMSHVCVYMSHRHHNFRVPLPHSFTKKLRIFSRYPYVISFFFSVREGTGRVDSENSEQRI